VADHVVDETTLSMTSHAATSKSGAGLAALMG